MADFLDFMLRKKETKDKNSESRNEKANYSIFMPVGVYDETEEVSDNSYAGWSSKQESNESRRGDYDPYSMEKLKSEEQLIELKRLITASEDTIRELNDTITKLRNDISAVEVERSRYQHISSTYRAMVEKIVKIMPYYKEIEFTGIGSPEEWKDRELVEIFVTSIEKIKVELSERVSEIEKLKTLINSSQNSSTEKSDDDMVVSDDLIDDIQNELLADTVDVFKVEATEEIDIFSDEIVGEATPAPIIATDAIRRYSDKIKEDPQLGIILETIGETGLSRVIELKETDKFKEAFASANGDFTQGTLSKKMKTLEDLTILNVEKINTGRKGGQENIYTLSELGKQLYVHEFSSQPVESEREEILRQHTSLEHGYFIKTVAREMENKGYEVFDSPEDCVRKPLVSNEEGDDKLRVEADLILKKDGVEYIVECEMGTTSSADMNKKLDKLILVTNVISFIMNNQESLSATSSKVDKWITKKGRNNLQGYTFRFSTIDTLKKREIWQNKGPF